MLLRYHVLSELFYGSRENEVLSVKIGARILDLWLDLFFWAIVAQMEFLGRRP